MKHKAVVLCRRVLAGGLGAAKACEVLDVQVAEGVLGGMMRAARD
jgi:hypothetical protein